MFESQSAYAEKSQAQRASIVIIGSGFSGLALAIRLKQSGFNDFVILERADEVGGTWRDNTYPGCACDIESHVYSYSFAPNPTWTQTFSPQPEILAYLKNCVREFHLTNHLRFSTTVEELTWNVGAREWQISTSKGPWRSSYVVAGVGPLSEPALPKFFSGSEFQGEVFHSSQWPKNFDARGKRIAVIGTGASAIQFLPTLQKEAREVLVFQRTPPWVIPRLNRNVSRFEKFVFRKWPRLQGLVRRAIFSARELLVFALRRLWALRAFEFFIRWQLAQTIADRELRAKLTPQYRLGCKRVLLSNEYWPLFTKANVRLITDSIKGLKSSSVEAGDATYPVDTVIFGTGFRVTDAPFFKRVINGQGTSLADAWQGSPKAFLGVATAGFPNLFFLLGPNTGLGHNSVVAMVEVQVEYILKFLAYARETQVRSIEAKPEAQSDYVESLGKEIRHTVWSRGGCLSWYIDRTGRNSTLWPRSATAYAERLKAFDPADYELTR